jgi:hypothetical protein
MGKLTVTLFAALLVTTVQHEQAPSCEEDCRSYCHVSFSGRQFVRQNECFAKCWMQHKEER